jgi:hypothetical protein
MLIAYLIGVGVSLVIGALGMYLMREEGTRGDRIAMAIGFVAAAVLWPVVAPIAAVIIVFDLKGDSE